MTVTNMCSNFGGFSLSTAQGSGKTAMKEWYDSLALVAQLSRAGMFSTDG